MATKPELLQFVDEMRAVGRVTPNTAAGLRSAILRVFPDGEDISGIDAGKAAKRLKGLSPASLQSVMRRAALVLKLYADLQENKDMFMRPKVRDSGPAAAADDAHHVVLTLRSGKDARIEVPRDFVAEDIERIAALLKALMRPE